MVEKASFTAESVPDHSGIATDDDIYYAYRLLLGREPDAAGWQGHRSQIASEGLSATEVARRFMLSSEFQNRTTILEMPMDGFSIFVRSDDRDIGNHLRMLRSYEPHVTAALRALLRPDMV